MERAPEPELMDDDAQARAYAEADFTEPHERFIETFRRCFPGLALEGSVLDLGCGPADVTVRFARAFPRCHIDGVDGAEAMLRYGHARLLREQLEGRVRLLRAYLPDEAPPSAPYDAVISNSLLHHLADASTLWTSVRRFVAKGAPVFIMDLMRPADDHSARALVREHAAGEPEVLQRDFYASLLAAYTLEEVGAQLAAHELSHLSVAAESDRHLIVYGRL